MVKTKHGARKLSLHRETVKTLTALEIGAVFGGARNAHTGQFAGSCISWPDSGAVTCPTYTTCQTLACQY